MTTEITHLGPMVVLEHQLLLSGGSVTERVSVVRDVVVWSAVCGVVRVPGRGAFAGCSGARLVIASRTSW